MKVDNQFEDEKDITEIQKFLEEYPGNIEELSYYELTELIQQFYMNKI